MPEPAEPHGAEPSRSWTPIPPVEFTMLCLLYALRFGKLEARDSCS